MKFLPWRRWLQIGLGILGWSTKQFWAATPKELYAAVEGWQESHGVKDETLTYEEIAELDELMNKFPDEVV